MNLLWRPSYKNLWHFPHCTHNAVNIDLSLKRKPKLMSKKRVGGSESGLVNGGDVRRWWGRRTTPGVYNGAGRRHGTCCGVPDQVSAQGNMFTPALVRSYLPKQ